MTEDPRQSSFAHMSEEYHHDKKHRSRLNFYEIQDLPLFLRRFWALKRECSELHDR